MVKQQQYLFPQGAAFGRDNLVLHAEAKRHVVKDFPGPLSIKSVTKGEVAWTVDGRDLTLDNRTFLVLGDGQKYTMNIDAPKPVGTCCAFFRHGFVEQVAQDVTRSLQASLDEPQRVGSPLLFLSRLHRDRGCSVLGSLWSIADWCRGQLQPSGYEERFLILSHQLISLYREITDQVARVPAAKASTREELFRRLQLAREYIHGNVSTSLSLEQIARESCLSRYHLHRVFRQVFQRTPHAYLTMLRLEMAQSMLQNGRSVTETCVEIGFTSTSSFSRLFRKHLGLSPSCVRKIRNIG